MRKFILLGAVAMALAFILDRASADPVFSITGTALFNKTNYTQGSQQVATTLTYSLNNKSIYNLISNAVANAGTYDSALTTTNLPANGYIAYNLSATNAINLTTYDVNISYSQIVGAFYVTNKSGFYYPLSGLDTGGNYYSFMELDTWDNQYWQLGFWYNFNPVTSYKVNNGNGSEADTESALLYINDNPLQYDDADYPGRYLYNVNAIAIQGILKINLSIKNGFITKGSGSFSGTGNLILGSQPFAGVVSSGTMRLQ